VNDIIRYYKGIRPCKIIVKGLKQDVLIQYLDDNTLDRTQIRLCHKNQKKVNKMPTKQPTKPKVVKPKPKESKTDIFTRLAKPRVVKILKSLRILGNCSNRSRYEYTQEQIAKIFEKIYDAVNKAELKFTETKAEQETFEF